MPKRQLNIDRGMDFRREVWARKIRVMNTQIVCKAVRINKRAYGEIVP